MLLEPLVTIHDRCTPISREREVARFTVESKKIATMKRERERERERVKKGQKYESAPVVYKCPHPRKETGRTRFSCHDFKSSGESVPNHRMIQHASCVRRRVATRFLYTETSMHRRRVTFNWVICTGTPSIRAVIGLI